MGNSQARLRAEFLGSVVLLALVALLPLVLTSVYWQGVVIVSLYYALQAMGWNVVAGYTGQINLAPAAFAMVGAYGVGLLSHHWGVSPWLGIPVGVLAAALIGLVLGRIVLRLQGAYVALTTLSFGEILRVVIANSYDITRGDLGLNVPATLDTRVAYYYLMLGVVVVVQIAIYAMMRSRAGLFFQTIRDDEVAAASRGISVVWWKTLAFVISSTVCGLAGTLYAPFAGLISPELGLILNTGLVVSMVVIGGMGTMIGPIAGALLVYPVGEILRELGGYHLIVFALLVIAFARFFRGGIWGLLRLAQTRWRGQAGVTDS